MKTWHIVVGSLGVVVLLVAMGFLPLGSRAFLAPITGTFEKQIITNRGAYQIQSYEDFHRWARDIEAVDQKLAAYPAADLDIRQRTECQALLSRRANLVARYNAAADAEQTRGQWRAINLPLSMEQSQPRTC